MVVNSEFLAKIELALREVHKWRNMCFELKDNLEESVEIIEEQNELIKELLGATDAKMN